MVENAGAQAPRVWGGFGCGGNEAFMIRARMVFDGYDKQGQGRLERREVKLAWMALPQAGCKPSCCEF